MVIVIEQTAPKAIHSTDFLNLLMSYLPSGGKYSNDARVWTQAVYILSQRHKKEHFELFSDLGFVIARPSGSIYSRKVNGWMKFFSMLIGGIREPSYHKEEGLEYLRFPESFQQEKREQLVRRFSQEIVITTQQFAEEVAKEGLLDPVRKT
jgi:hypothetical protein